MVLTPSYFGVSADVRALITLATAHRSTQASARCSTSCRIDYLERQAAAGVMVEGAAEESLAAMRVVAR